MIRKILIPLCVLMVASCSTGPTTRSSVDSSSGHLAELACGSTHALTGRPPEWTMEIARGNVPDGLPYVLASPPNIVGYLFNRPLRSGGRGDKVLWIARGATADEALRIEATAMGSGRDSLTTTWPPSAGTGQYPTGLAVPTPGCWHLKLSWAGQAAVVDLDFAGPNGKPLPSAGGVQVP